GVALLQARGDHVKKTLHASEQDRADIARRRTRWKAHQGRLDPKRLGFIDETPAFAGAGLYGAGSVKPDFSIRGALAAGRGGRATELYSAGPRDLDHDAVMRIDWRSSGAAGPFSRTASKPCLPRVTAASDRHGWA